MVVVVVRGVLGRVVESECDKLVGGGSGLGSRW